MSHLKVNKVLERYHRRLDAIAYVLKLPHIESAVMPWSRGVEKVFVGDAGEARVCIQN